MEPTAGNSSKYSLHVGPGFVGALCLAWSCVATAQGLSDNISSLSGSASVFTGITHTRTDLGGATDTNTKPGVGVSGQLGGQLESGANALVLQYGGTLQTPQDTIGNRQASNTSVTGASRYTYFDPNGRVDFNLGHTISSVRNNTGFAVNSSRYNTRNSLNAGAGLNFYPGDLSTVRFFGQAGRSFTSGVLRNQQSYTVGSELSRRLNERSTGGLNLSRSWSDKRNTNLTIDTAQLVYSLQTESGSFRIGAGGSQAKTEYNDGTTSKNDGVTGFAERAWVTSNWRTSVKYDRRLSDSATDLSLNLPPVFSFLPQSVRLRDLVLRDSLSLTHNTQLVCDACIFGFYVQGAQLESQNSGTTTYQYRANANFGFQLTSLQRLDFRYTWTGDSNENATGIIDQIHRLKASWTRQIAENTTFGVEFNQAYLRSKSIRNDKDQFEVRLVLSRGFSLAEVGR